MAGPVVFRGFRADRRSTKMIEEAEKLGGPLTITQGSYSHGSQSAGTHSGGGVFDFSVRSLTLTQINRRVRALRRVGFAAWHRTPDEGNWAAHIHAVAVGCDDLSDSAERQVAALRRGRNGLRNNALDRHRAMNLPVISWEEYLAARTRPVDVSSVANRARRTGRYVGRVAAALRAEGFSANRKGYARWQRRLNFSGADADGIAGLTSLRKLGRKHGWTVKP